MGAAFLLKAAAKLGLSESFGAQHLAAAPEGRGLHWPTFNAALDTIDLTKAEEARGISDAQTTFRPVHSLLREMFG